ncbi:hypothetical protein VTK73DRAFT_2128 [Phialemonium thermophilum]|uniref:Uncharacterized protein n=1 Tax=Phialemonium thermophilum TaxID=223376 RepID=A0ABR3VSI4_9PEZI
MTSLTAHRATVNVSPACDDLTPQDIRQKSTLDRRRVEGARHRGRVVLGAVQRKLGYPQDVGRAACACVLVSSTSERRPGEPRCLPGRPVPARHRLVDGHVQHRAQRLQLQHQPRVAGRAVPLEHAVGEQRAVDGIRRVGPRVGQREREDAAGRHVDAVGYRDVGQRPGREWGGRRACASPDRVARCECEGKHAESDEPSVGYHGFLAVESDGNGAGRSATLCSREQALLLAAALGETSFAGQAVTWSAGWFPNPIHI